MKKLVIAIGIVWIMVFVTILIGVLRAPLVAYYALRVGIFVSIAIVLAYLWPTYWARRSGG